MKNKLSLFILLGALLFSLNSNGQTYCSSSYSVFWQDYISNVSFNAISNPTGPSPYSDYTASQITEIGIGTQYNLTVTIVNFNIPNTIYVMAWIDWNHDYDFTDPGEAFSVGSVIGQTFGTPVSVNITVPAGAVLDTTRMRISASRGFVPTPCNTPPYLYGETEDYSTIITSSPVTWDGDVNSEWDNPLNWNGDIVPDVTTPVLIPSGLSFYPDFAGTLYVGASYGPRACKTLMIESGASVTLGGYGQISIFDDVTVNGGGSLTANILRVGGGGRLFVNGGTVTSYDLVRFSNSSAGSMNSGSIYVGGSLEFNTSTGWSAGGGTIYIMAGSTTNISCLSPISYINNLTVENGAVAALVGSSTQDLFIAGNFTVEPDAEFTMEAPLSGANLSQIIVGQSLTLEGTFAGKASFVDEDGATFLTYGSTVVENNYSDNRWHFVTSPVSSAVSGVFVDLYLKELIEADNAYTPSPGITSTTYPMGIGQGFETWSDIGNPKISYTGGQLNTGDISPAFTATDSNTDLAIGDGEGWNLIGNPYPSAIDVGTENDPVSGYTWTNIDSTIYVWNGSSWATFNMAGNGSGVNGGTRYVPSMQAFLLKANDFSPSFEFANSARLHNSQPNYKSELIDNSEIKLRISGNGYTDEILVRAINSATVNFDSKFDAYKLPGLDMVPQLFCRTSDSKLSINSLPEFTAESTIPVFVKVGADDIYKIEANDFDLSVMGLQVYLEDIKEKTFMKLDDETVYEFSSNPTDDEHRFNLVFKNAIEDDIQITSTVQIFASEDIIHVRKEAGINTNIFVYDMMGREVGRKMNDMNDRCEIQITTGTGNYIVKLVSSSLSETKKVFIK